MDFEKAYNNLLRDIEIAIKGATNKDTITVLKNIKSRNAESEDERIRKSIIRLIQQGGYMSPSDKTKAFAYLEKQKEQKPAEWSEEDKKMIDNCIELVLFAMPANMSAIKTREQCIILLKSLRPQPHWKPSEEEMQALMRAITWLVENGNHTVSSTLADLRSNLQKLM